MGEAGGVGLALALERAMAESLRRFGAPEFRLYVDDLPTIY
ncbi:hypothetical protein [Hydrogenophaga sp.]|nr:hypothetical protein [Hydrogenophaga sp.]